MVLWYSQVPSEAPVQPQVDDTYADIDDSEESEEGTNLFELFSSS